MSFRLAADVLDYAPYAGGTLLVLQTQRGVQFLHQSELRYVQVIEAACFSVHPDGRGAKIAPLDARARCA